MRIILQPGYILHQRPYRETSVILEVFTPEHGRVALVARGVRQPKAKWRPLLQPFVPLLLSWQGRGEMMSLSMVEPNGHGDFLRGNGLLSGFYLNELLLRLLQKQDPHPNLYHSYAATISKLAQFASLEKYLRLFEKNLLTELGFGLQLQENIAAEKFYHFYPESGFVIVANDNMADQKDAFPGSSLLALAANQLEDINVLRDSKRLMRRALDHLLEFKPLNTRKLFTEKLS
jgi:DNA repair protein RecO (recombination protein O)